MWNEADSGQTPAGPAPPGSGDAAPEGPGGEAFRAAAAEVLQTAIAALGAAFGKVQLFNARRGALEIVAHSGFPREFLELFALVTPAGPSKAVCARAFRLGRAVMIADVAEDPEFAPYLEMALQCGFRAVLCTPIVRNGGAVGVLSTHFAEVTRLAPELERVLDQYAAAIARLLPNP
jgi:GAF domain-containing protein